MKCQKLIAMTITASLAISALSMSVLATDGETDKTIKNIPQVYVTYADPDVTDSLDSSFDYESQYQLQQSGVSTFDTNQLTVEKLTTEEMLSAADSPIMKAAGEQIKECRDQGFHVSSVNIIVPSESKYALAASGEDYWYNNSYYWGYRDGFNFRYYFTQFGIYTDFTDVKRSTIPSTWDGIVKRSIAYVGEYFVDKASMGTWSWAKSIGDILGVSSGPAIKFSDSNNYIQGQLDGTLYYKNIVIQDKDNKISGNSYYPWGHVQELSIFRTFKIKYTVSEINGKPTYSIKTSTDPSPKIYVTPNYNNAQTIFSRTINYYNYTGFQHYYEQVEIETIPELK